MGVRKFCLNETSQKTSGDKTIVPSGVGVSVNHLLCVKPVPRVPTVWLPLLYLCSCALLLASQVTAPLTSKERKQILQDHNHYRSQLAHELGANIQILEWDPQLEAWAKHHTETCFFESSDSEDRGKFVGYEHTAENIWGTTSGGEPDLKVPINEWFSEGINFNNETMSCESNKTCDNYTQMIWATSRKVGCSYSTCYTEMGTFLACVYAPSGDWREEEPYKKGSFCTMCASDFMAGCLEYLCSRYQKMSEVYKNLEHLDLPVSDAGRPPFLFTLSPGLHVTAIFIVFRWM